MKSKLTQTACGYIFLEATTHSVPKKPNLYFWGFFTNKNLTKICFQMVSYKVYHRMITPNSNIYQSQYKISIQCHTGLALFWDLESRINSLRTMKKKAKNIDRSIQNGAISINFFVKWQLCFELPFKLVNPAPFFDSTTHSKFNCLIIQPRSSLQNSCHSGEKSPKI